MQDAESEMQSDANTNGITTVNTNPTITGNNSSKINKFLPGPRQEADRRVSAKLTQQLQKEFKDVSKAIGCFGGTFSL